MTIELKRGEKNHNPFDLEHAGIPWQGMTGTDGPFCVFADDAHGLRAGFRDLHTAWLRDGKRNIAAIVTAYAPPSENDTADYVAHVGSSMTETLKRAIGPLTPLNLDDPDELLALGTAVIHEEQSRCIYAPAALVLAVHEALGK
jgi:hypothetical protein